MGKIYMVGAMKGGVGKSVTVFNLAYSLWKMGKKVLAVDFDPQSNLTTYFGAEELVEYDHRSLLRILRIMQIPVMASISGHDRHIEGIRGNDGKILRQIRIFDSKIPNMVKVGESVYYSEPLIEYAPGCNACRAYDRLAGQGFPSVPPAR